REYLPEYMVPSWFVVLDDLPRTSHGKVNRRALPAPKGLCSMLATPSVSPRTRVERVIASIWQEVLQIEGVSIHHNFFDLGGHSLLMLQVHSKVREAFGTEISLLDMFQYSTVASLAQHVSLDVDADVGTRREASSPRGAIRKEAIERQK